MIALLLMILLYNFGPIKGFLLFFGIVFFLTNTGADKKIYDFEKELGKEK